MNAILRHALVVILALAAAGLARPVHASEGAVGRLFTTPAERRALDEERRRGGQRDAISPAGLAAVQADADRRVVMNGLVRSRHAQPVVWINGRPVSVMQPPDVQNRVILPGTSTIRLKPGQSWDPVTGRVRDCAQCSGPVPQTAAAVAPSSGEPKLPAVAQSSDVAATVAPGSARP